MTSPWQNPPPNTDDRRKALAKTFDMPPNVTRTAPSEARRAAATDKSWFRENPARLFRLRPHVVGDFEHPIPVRHPVNAALRLYTAVLDTKKAEFLRVPFFVDPAREKIANSDAHLEAAWREFANHVGGQEGDFLVNALIFAKEKPDARDSNRVQITTNSKA